MPKPEISRLKQYLLTHSRAHAAGARNIIVGDIFERPVLPCNLLSGANQRPRNGKMSTDDNAVAVEGETILTIGVSLKNRREEIVIGVSAHYLM